MFTFLTNWDAAIQHWAAGLGMPAEAVLRLLLAAVFGGVCGIERELRGRQAGFRTYLLVCVGSALLMVVSLQFAVYPWQQPAHAGPVTIGVDPARIAYSIMTGIGFLGAGTIVQSKGTVRGLTTAAGIWCVAAVGMTVGFGMYLIALLATVLVVGALWVLGYLDDVLPKLHYRTVTVRTKWQVDCVAGVIKHFESGGMNVADVSFERNEPDLTTVDVHLRIAFHKKAQYYSFEHKLEGDGKYVLLATREI